MFDGIRNRRRLRRVTRTWLWEDLFDTVSDFLRSRSLWVVAGNAGMFLSALAGLVHYWSRPPSFAGCAALQLACLACQAVALIPVAWPGRTARGIADFSDLHQGMTVATLCGTWIFGVFPGASLLVFFDVNVNSPPWAALFISGTALMVAGVAGLITATVVSDGVGTQRHESVGSPGGSGWGDSGDSADVDSGGFDSD